MKKTYSNISSLFGFKTVLFICSILFNLNLYSQCDSQLAYWNFDDCTAGNMVKDGTLPTQTNNGGCTTITTSISRIDPANSCVDRGSGNKANCFGQNAIPSWVDNSPKAVVTTVSFPTGSTGKLSGMMFTIAVHNLVDWNNQPNHYPTKWGIRVVKNGNQIFKQIDIPFTPDVWTPVNYDWSANPSFQVTGATTFKIELLAYAPGTTNSSSSYEVWELDDVIILGGCCTLPSNCNLTNPGLTGVTCKNNNTGNNPLDDYIEFKLNPTGTGIGTQYKVVVNGGATVTPSQANYGSATTFRLQNGSAGSGNKIITISDKTNPNCTIMVSLSDPGTCSSTPPCNISDPGLNNITCNNNGTASDASDDKVSFSLNPIGTGLSSSYSVYINGSSVMPSSANYGTNTTFMMPAGSAGNGPWVVTVKDNTVSSTCSLSFVLIDPGTCSSNCPSITYPICSGESYTMTVATSNLTNIQWQKNINGVWTNISGGTGNSFTANSIGIYRYIAKDNNNCNIELCCPFVIVEGNCPNTCSIKSDGLSGVACNSNATNTDPSDDYVTFSLNPNGIGLGGTQYNISSNTGTIDPTFGTYGTSTLFTLSNGTAGNGNITITITDAVYNTCSKSINIPNPGVCSCTLVNMNLSTPECSNNGTSSSIDDFIKFSLNPNGIIGESYSVSVSSGSIFPSSGIYGSPTFFQLQPGSAGAGNVEITVKDDIYPSCFVKDTIIDPRNCSNCQIMTPITVYVNCDNKGTVSTLDDEWVITASVSGINLSSTYNAQVTCSGIGCVSCQKSGVSYNTLTEICRMPISNMPVSILITDQSGASCSATQNLEPILCKVCSVNKPNLTVQDNICPSRTGSINLDQGCGSGSFIQYSLNNGKTWSTVKPLYSTTPRTILARCVNSSDTTCKSINTSVTTVPIKCSITGNECTISAIASIDPCNNKGTDDVAADDYFTIQVSATVANGGSSNKYEVVIGADPLTGTGGNVLNSGGTNYGSPITVGNTKIFKADGTSNYQLVVRDINNNNCFQLIDIQSVAPCSIAPPKSPCYPVPCVPLEIIKN